MSGEKPRQIAARVLKQAAQEGLFLDFLLDPELARANLSPADRALTQELAYGVVRWQATLDWLIARKTQGRTQKLDLQILLRLGLYQLFWLSRIPDHAAVHETVQQAKQLGLTPQAGFVNAVLRGYLREREPTRQQLEELKHRQPAVGYSHPDWLCERWRQRWGEEKLRQLLEWDNTPPPAYARLNTLRSDAGNLAGQWRVEGVQWATRAWDWTGTDLVFELQSHPPLASLLSFQHGWFYVQDPGTLLAVRELNPQPGEAVLDFCAAPGGKTTFIAQLMQNQGSVVAQDVDARRCELIRQNCERLGVLCAQVVCSSADRPPRRFEPFDRILVDAPCSNTGVMRRRVDLRWRVRPEEIERLRSGQLDLLRRAAALLKPRGALVYSTCSLEPEENSGVVQAFLAEHRHFRLESERTLLPFVEGVDGAYMARLRAA